MSPRPRTISDDEILAAARRAIAERGPAGFTLAAAGEQAGIAPATLVQRFGSKRGLTVFVMQCAATGTAARFRDARARSRTALGAVFRGLEERVAAGVHPDALARELAFRQHDLADPLFRHHALAEARAVRRALRILFDEAVTRGELRPCGTRRLARAAHAIATGALATWSITREGRARRHLRNALQMLVAPYRTPARRFRTGRKKAR